MNCKLGLFRGMSIDTLVGGLERFFVRINLPGIGVLGFD